MGIKENMEEVLKSLKDLGWSRSQIEEHLGYEPKYITQQLSKGTNERLLSRLAKLRREETLKKSGTSGSNLQPVDLKSKNESVITIPVADYIKGLESDKQTLKDSIQLSLNALLEGQSLIRDMLVVTRDNSIAIRLAVSKDPELEAAYEESKKTAERLKAQQKDKSKDKSRKGLKP